jgi:hypothetical protein
MRRLALVLLLAAAGCSHSSESTYPVAHDSDTFNEIVDGKIVRYANWQLTIEHKPAEKKVIDIPHKPSTIKIHHHGKHMQIEVNGTSVYED